MELKMTVKSSNGSAIISVLLVFLLLTILGTTLLNMDLVEMKILSSDKIHQAAYYYAEAGLVQQTEVLRTNVEKLYNDPMITSRDLFLGKLLQTPIVPPKFEDYNGEKVKIEIVRQRNKSVVGKDEIKLVSTCSIGNVNRAVRAVVHLLWEDPREEGFMLDHTNFSIVEWREAR